MEEIQTEQPKKRMSNLALRTITGSCYIAVLLAFFLLKIFISDLFFDALILAFALVGTWEMTRAFKDKMHASQKIVVMIFSALVIISYAASDFYFADIRDIHLPGEGGFAQALGRNYSMHIVFGVFMAGLSVLFALLVFSHSRVSLESTGYALLSLIYPSFFLVLLSVCAHLEIYSELALLLVFVISPFADTFAFIFGRSLGKYLPKKMAPNISPKKTLIGGFGGLIGGAIGAVVVFFAYYGIMQLDDIGATTVAIQNIDIDALNLVFFIGLGILTSAFSQFGDLVESGIKRKLDIKDMGKILPGHGGILDRIDSALYAGLIVSLAMVGRIMIAP